MPNFVKKRDTASGPTQACSLACGNWSGINSSKADADDATLIERVGLAVALTA